MKSASSKACLAGEQLGRERACIALRGAVQGVGFRPFVYRLAGELGLAGWVRNSPAGVRIEVEGERERLDEFIARLTSERPAAAAIDACEVSFGVAGGWEGFEIRESDDRGVASARILPDLGTCSECQRELFDPGNRRYRYPFTNCTHCGPRFSIVEALPYDRENTTMRMFPMCVRCAEEYRDPENRRFYAQPNACPECGPQLALWNRLGGELAQRDAAVREAALQLRRGAIVALKGIGGFQLLVDARNDEAVRRLRARKHRPDKPLAIMGPSLDATRAWCVVSDLEAKLLTSPAAPIVLLERKQNGGEIAPAVAPGNPYLGVMLPYSPLHHVLLAELDFPIVATSGNLSDEPICTDEHEAIARLRGVADVFLVHDRPIARAVDDSVVRVLRGREQVLRRARGYAPAPVQVSAELPPILGVGAQMKNAVALSVGHDVFLSQHIGDLETPQAIRAFERAAVDLPRLYERAPPVVACDLHPHYVPTRFAYETSARVVAVQHHYAHVLACMAEHRLEPPVLGVCWDGTGYGPDGTIWGGEFLRINESWFERVARFRPFPLVGGDTAAREPRRSAIGVLRELWGDAAFFRDDLAPVRSFSPAERHVLRQALARGINTVSTSSAGRLFDAAASLLGLRQRVSFEGQAAMELEFAIDPRETAAYPVDIGEGAMVEFDWRATMAALVDDLENGVEHRKVATRFHAALVEAMMTIVERAGLADVVLTGGCFQNRWLAERAAGRLETRGFRVHWPQCMPPNDGGIALGQVMAAARVVRTEKEFHHVSRDSR